MLESKFSKALEDNSFAASFKHQELRTITRRWEKAGGRWDYRLIGKSMGSPEGAELEGSENRSFKGVLT